MVIFIGLNSGMQLTMVMYYLTLPPTVDASLFEDVSNFLSLDVSYEAQQATVEFISKLHTCIDKFTEFQRDPVLTNIRIHYDLDYKQNVFLSVGFTDMDWYHTVYEPAQETIEGFSAFRAWLAAYNITLEEIRSNTVDVEFFPNSCIYLGIPVNYSEMKYLYDAGTPFVTTL
jgi:hypothetical protein